jgi:hypothetical protein
MPDNVKLLEPRSLAAERVFECCGGNPEVGHEEDCPIDELL